MSATPSLRKLQYVLAVARELHFGKAAERLHVERSSISRQVREVEQEVGFEIFRRDNHYVAITDAGQPFVQALKEMLTRLDAEFERATDVSRLISRRSASSLLIGYTAFVAGSIRHKIRAIQKQKFPSLHLELRLATAPELVDSLSAEIFQACVTFGPLDGSTSKRSPCTPNLCARFHFAHH